MSDDELLAVHDSRDLLAVEDPQAAVLVKLRYFAGITMQETACAMGLSKRTAEGIWTYAKAWLGLQIRKDNQ